MLKYLVILFLLINLSGDNSIMFSGTKEKPGIEETVWQQSFLVLPGATVLIPFQSQQLTSFGRLSLGVTTDYPDEVVLIGSSGEQAISIRVKRKFAWETYQFRDPLYLYNPYSDFVKVDVKIVGTPGR